MERMPTTTKGEGPAIECSRAVDQYRKAHPGASWLEIFENVPNHYSHHRSLAQAMKQVTERRTSGAVTVEEGIPT
jgi:cysteine synthase